MSSWLDQVLLRGQGDRQRGTFAVTRMTIGRPGET